MISKKLRPQIQVDEKYKFLLTRYTWSVVKGDNTYYATTRFYKDKRYIQLHRLIMILEGKNIDGKEIDHIDGNGLNNTVENLRIASSSLNKFNRLNYGNVGVRFRRNNYYARIKVDKKEIHLGIFKTEKEAIEARKLAELKYFSEVAKRSIL